MELTTGRKANHGDENRSLAEWAQDYFRGGKSIADALDENIKEACNLNQMCNVFKLGIYCTRTLPSLRPCMRTVLQMLLQSNHPHNCQDTNGEKEYDTGHLLKISKEGSTSGGDSFDSE